MLNHRIVPHGHPVQVGQERGWIVGETCMGVPLVQFADRLKGNVPQTDVRSVFPCFLNNVS